MHGQKNIKLAFENFVRKITEHTPPQLIHVRLNLF